MKRTATAADVRGRDLDASIERVTKSLGEARAKVPPDPSLVAASVGNTTFRLRPFTAHRNDSGAGMVVTKSA